MTVELSEDQFGARIIWVEELVSGNHPQGHGRLRDSDGLCCLGVACKVLEPDNPILDTNQFLDDGLVERLGLITYDADSSDIGLIHSDQVTSATWNDTKKLNFSRIADLVAAATEDKVMFYKINPEEVPEGYAQTWLALRRLT